MLKVVVIWIAIFASAPAFAFEEWMNTMDQIARDGIARDQLREAQRQTRIMEDMEFQNELSLQQQRLSNGLKAIELNTAPVPRY